MDSGVLEAEGSAVEYDSPLNHVTHESSLVRGLHSPHQPLHPLFTLARCHPLTFFININFTTSLHLFIIFLFLRFVLLITIVPIILLGSHFLYLLFSSFSNSVSLIFCLCNKTLIFSLFIFLFMGSLSCHSLFDFPAFCPSIVVQFFLH